MTDKEATQAVAPPVSVELLKSGPWFNYHETVVLKRAGRARIAGTTTGDWREEPAATWQARELGELVAALQRHLASGGSGELLTYGAAWSHERWLATAGLLISGDGAAGVVEVQPDVVRPASTEPLCLVAGGTRLSALSRWLERRGWMLRTSGSHGAASVAGALATGTHGARRDRRGVEEHVRGLLLVTGPRNAAWVGPTRGYRIAGDLLQAIAPGAVEIYEDEAFASALSHLGGLGIVVAVLAAAEARTGFLSLKRILPLWQGWADDWSRGDLDSIGGRVWSQFPNLPGPPPKLISCELNLDPRRLSLDQDVEPGNGCFAVRYEGGPVAPGLVEGEPDLASVDILARALETADASSAVSASSAPDLGRLFELSFNTEQTSLKVKEVPARSWGALLPADQGLLSKAAQIWSAAIAVPRSETARALASLAAATSERPRSFVICLRPTLKSMATLGFCAFEDTTVINVDGLGPRFNREEDELERTALTIRRGLDADELPYRMHWGKLAGIDAGALASHYGDPREPRSRTAAWLRTRARLLDEAGTQPVFTSPRLRSLELA